MTGLIFHLIPRPRGDREWYLPRAAFQARLVAVLDDLIERLQRDPAYRSFLLDGQTVLLEDYVRARPERDGDIKALVKTGRLQIGPWYVLPDEQIPSGEGLVRNLLLGAADAERWGGRLDVLYSPDAFGHPAAWPTLAREFGIRYGVVWRGLGGETGQERDLYRWRGLDDKEVLLWHLPRAGYEIGAALPADAERLFAAWAPVRGALVQRATGKHVPVFIGADHHGAHPDVPRLRDLLAELDPQSAFRVSRLDEFFQAAADGAKPSPLAGELRWSYRYAWTLQGVHGTRAPLKRRYSAAELALARVAEPLAALARRAGGRGLPAVRARDLGWPHRSGAAARPADRDGAAGRGAPLPGPGRGGRGAHCVPVADGAGAGIGQRRPGGRCHRSARYSTSRRRRARERTLAHQPLDRGRDRAHRGTHAARPALGAALYRSAPNRGRRRCRGHVHLLPAEGGPALPLGRSDQGRATGSGAARGRARSPLRDRSSRGDTARRHPLRRQSYGPLYPGHRQSGGMASLARAIARWTPRGRRRRGDGVRQRGATADRRRSGGLSARDPGSHGAGARVRGGGVRGTRDRALGAGLLRVRMDQSRRPARDPAARGGRAVARRPLDPTGSRGLAHVHTARAMPGTDSGGAGHRTGFRSRARPRRRAALAVGRRVPAAARVLAARRPGPRADAGRHRARRIGARAVGREARAAGLPPGAALLQRDRSEDGGGVAIR